MHSGVGLGSGVSCSVVSCGVALRGEAAEWPSWRGPVAGRVSPSGEVIIQQVVLWVVVVVDLFMAHGVGPGPAWVGVNWVECGLVGLG